MNNKSTITTHARDMWLKGLKSLTIAVMERDALLQDLCPYTSRHSSDEDKTKTLEQIVTKTRDISQCVQSLLESEQGFGVTALIPSKPVAEETALTLYLAIGARLSGNIARSFRRVEDYTSLLGARDAVQSLRIRNLFRSDSVLESLIALGSGVVLDERVVVLRESAFNKAMGQSDDRTTILCEAEAIPNRRV